MLVRAFVFNELENWRAEALLKVNTYFIRHTMDLDVDDDTRKKLWDKKLIAIHFPRHKDGKKPTMRRRDNASLDPDKYSQKGRSAMKILCELAKSGGYVCAEYAHQDESRLGYVRPGSRIRLFRGKWGIQSGLQGKVAVLKSLRIKKVRDVGREDAVALLMGRPRHGTMARWIAPGTRVADLVEGRPVKRLLANLSTPQQEIMCSEFLRSSMASRLGLPRLAHLLVPVGRTMRDIDLSGVTKSGRRIFAQITYEKWEHCGKKPSALRKYRKGSRDTLVFFCNCPKPADEGGVRIIPLERVYKLFVSSSSGKLWAKHAFNPGS